MGVNMNSVTILENDYNIGDKVEIAGMIHHVQGTIVEIEKYALLTYLTVENKKESYFIRTDKIQSICKLD